MTISKPYDHGSRRLLSASTQALLDWLAPDARFTGQFSEQFHSADAWWSTPRSGRRDY